ncbi:MAG: hypothetical protein LLF76_14700 [Planctomycetaceae bacterium]|nr:hypothetical protein [Planctomycetaceae bacterium]
MSAQQKICISRIWVLILAYLVIVNSLLIAFRKIASYQLHRMESDNPNKELISTLEKLQTISNQEQLESVGIPNSLISSDFAPTPDETEEFRNLSASQACQVLFKRIDDIKTGKRRFSSDLVSSMANECARKLDLEEQRAFLEENRYSVFATEYIYPFAAILIPTVLLFCLLFRSRFLCIESEASSLKHGLSVRGSLWTLILWVLLSGLYLGSLQFRPFIVFGSILSKLGAYPSLDNSLFAYSDMLTYGFIISITLVLLIFVARDLCTFTKEEDVRNERFARRVKAHNLILLFRSLLLAGGGLLLFFSIYAYFKVSQADEKLMSVQLETIFKNSETEPRPSGSKYTFVWTLSDRKTQLTLESKADLSLDEVFGEKYLYVTHPAVYFGDNLLFAQGWAHYDISDEEKRAQYEHVRGILRSQEEKNAHLETLWKKVEEQRPFRELEGQKARFLFHAIYYLVLAILFFVSFFWILRLEKTFDPRPFPSNGTEGTMERETSL